MTQIYRWQGGLLRPLDDADTNAAIAGTETVDIEIAAADSWLVTDGMMLAFELHRQRFEDALAGLDIRLDDAAGPDDAAALSDAAGLDLAAFWAAVIAAIPPTGDWFPRAELQRIGDDRSLLFRLRNSPERTRSVRLATHRGADPRSSPTIKGPATAELLLARTDAQRNGADDAVILSEDGYVVETTSSALLWWRGEILCAPAIELERVDSVTARSVLTLATALGIDVYYEAVTPAELDAVELWALNALQGIRIVTEWIDGPSMAELPGRLATWRTRLDRLRKPLL